MRVPEEKRCRIVVYDTDHNGKQIRQRRCRSKATVFRGGYPMCRVHYEMLDDAARRLGEVKAKECQTIK